MRVIEAPWRDMENGRQELRRPPQNAEKKAVTCERDPLVRL